MANAGPEIVWTASKGAEASEFVSRVKRDFETRWRRAHKDGRLPIWDEVDEFILKNWREIRWPELAKKLAKKCCRGLREWSPGAACALIRTLPEAEGVSCDETWYVQKRTRLGLKGKRRYRVHDFRRYKDGRCEVEID
jgi:hypothetical protein